MEIDAAYKDTRVRVISLVRDLPPEAAEMRIPACPQWTLRELVAHSAGSVTDVLAGRTEGAGSDPWTARQVEERRGRSLNELLAEWEEGAPELEARLPHLPRRAGILLVVDLETHEQDIRGAVNRPGGRESEDIVE